MQCEEARTDRGRRVSYDAELVHSLVDYDASQRYRVIKISVYSCAEVRYNISIEMSFS